MILTNKRFKLVKPFIKGKDVLDIGCVDHHAETEHQSDWLHKNIQDHAKSLLGIDVERKEVDKLKQKGYTMKAGNFETLNLKRKFDVITAGNVIEHVDNAGLFFENCRAHLKPKGKLVLTTDNTLGFRNILRAAVFSRIRVNPTHLCWYDHETLKIVLKRHKFRITHRAYFTDAKGWRFAIEFIPVLMSKLFAPYVFIVAEKE